MCGLFWSSTQAALEGAICIDHSTVSVLVKIHYLNCLALLPLAFLLEGRKVLQCKIEWARQCAHYEPAARDYAVGGSLSHLSLTSENVYACCRILFAIILFCIIYLSDHFHLSG